MQRRNKICRRSFMSGAVGLMGCGDLSGADPDAKVRARKLIAGTPSLDLHAHPGRTFVRGAQNLTPALQAFSIQGASETRAVEDMLEGGLTAAIFCAVADFQILDATERGLAPGRPFGPGEAIDSFHRQIGHLDRLVDRGLVKRISSPADVYAAKKDGVVGALIGVEGGDFLQGSVERVAQAFELGVRCLCPLHYSVNELGDAMTAVPVHGGLTKAGGAVVNAMNTHGMIIDVAHCSEQTAFDIIEQSDKPVLCSHTHVNSNLFSNPRFISGELAREVAAAGGVIGAWPAGIGIVDLDGFVDRIFELIDVVGVDYVGVGSDMDANYKPVWDNYRQFPDVVSRMLERGLSNEEAAKIIGGNGMRLFRAASR